MDKARTTRDEDGAGGVVRDLWFAGLQKIGASVSSGRRRKEDRVGTIGAGRWGGGGGEKGHRRPEMGAGGGGDWGRNRIGLGLLYKEVHVKRASL